MDRLRSHWTDRPDVLIQFRDIHYTVRVPIVDVTTRSFLQAGLNGLIRLVKRLDLSGYLRRHDRQIELHALATCSGRIAPGSMTLVLAPPGHGKSTLLRALAGRLQNDPNFGGEVAVQRTDGAAADQEGTEDAQAAELCGPDRHPLPRAHSEGDADVRRTERQRERGGVQRPGSWRLWRQLGQTVSYTWWDWRRRPTLSSATTC